MQIKIKGKIICTYSIKRLVCAMCFFLFCVIEQRLKSDAGMEMFRDLTGVGMAIIIMTHYRLEDFRKWKIPYLIWTAIWIIGTPIAFHYSSVVATLADWIVMALDVILFGYIVIHTVISVVIEEKRPELNIKYSAVWFLMMVLMILSRSTYIWPFCYLIMFGCFYLTDFSKEEQNELFQGMLDGIILGFFAIQGCCFIYRPYDSVRYKGAFTNSNLNGLFYLEVLTAVFTKIIYVTRKNCNKWIKLYYWAGAGLLLSLEVMTIGRINLLAAAVFSLVFCAFLKKHQIAKKAWKNMLALMLCVLITFPITFSAVRYLPTLFHHPVWFWGEWNESRVHPGDPWNSEKYIEIDEFLDAAFGRMLDSIQNVMEHSPLLMIVNAAGTDPADMEPVLDDEHETDSYLIRTNIYKYYFQHLNMRGYPYEEQGFQLTKTYWVPHAHNIYLQFGTDFGVPVMILYAVLIFWGAILLGKRYKQKGSETDAGYWMFLVIPAIYGLLEKSWGTGSLSILTMFIAWREVICCEKKS